MTRKILAQVAVALAILCACASTALATINACVDDTAGLQAALNAAITASDDTLIKITQGTYQPTAGFSYFGSTAHAVTIEGGYDAACNIVSADPSLTVFDGTQLSPLTGVFMLLANHNGGDVSVRYISLQHVIVSTEVLTIQLTGGNLLLENNRFLDNAITTADDAAFYFLSDHVGSGGGTVTIRNNLFARTEVPDGMYAINLYPPASAGNVNALAYFTNNTVTGTHGSGAHPSGGAFMFTAGTSSPMTISNNIFWGNAGDDLYTFAAYFDHNDLGVTPTLTMLTGSAGNVSVDPQFDSLQRYEPLAPMVANAGNVAAAGGVGTYDAAGWSRVVFGTIDMGAVSHDPLFAAGFDKSQ